MKPSHVFVLGTGRSGTCWMGKILGQHKDAESFVEPRILFDKASKAALFPDERETLFLGICIRIDSIAKETNLLPAYKIHQLLWMAEQLAKRYPDAKFIGMQRTVHACVASMLEHPGVSKWCKQWRRYPIPNEFLGITGKTTKEYNGYTLSQRCAQRWVTHYHRLQLAKSRLMDRLLVVDYERLVTKPKENLQRIQKFLELKKPFPTISTKSDSLVKWKKRLSKKEISEINQILRKHHLSKQMV